jgi:transcriptional regulator with PAS, ATPase and Fis domain
MGEKKISPDRVEALVRRKGFFRSLLDNMQVGVIVADYEGYVVYINDTYARFLNIDPAKEIGKHASEIGVNSRLHIVAKTGLAEVNYPHQFKDRAFLVHRVPVREKGKIIAVLGLVLFDSASTASKLAEKVSFLESKLSLYENELLSLRSTRYTMDSMVGASQAMKALKRQAVKAAATSLPVVITGESGTGKELLAQAIHHASSRRLYPFVRVNCAAIPRDLFESELFGYEKGAFTGAKSTGKPGKFELAHHGSVFLDEIGDLPLELQPKLLRVLEEKEFERIGGTTLIKADFRLLAATNHNLEEMLEQNRFREDLFYRLNVITLHIPPLRERTEDILPIAQHLLKRIAQDAGLTEILISPEAAAVLSHHDWPGNVREVSNVLERAASYLERNTIYPCDLPPYLHRGQKGATALGRTSLRSMQNRAESEAIRYALESVNFNKARAAELLGIHRSLLYKKMQKYDIPLVPNKVLPDRNTFVLDH